MCMAVSRQKSCRNSMHVHLNTNSKYQFVLIFKNASVYQVFTITEQFWTVFKVDLISKGIPKGVDQTHP